MQTMTPSGSGMTQRDIEAQLGALVSAPDEDTPIEESAEVEAVEEPSDEIAEIEADEGEEVDDEEDTPDELYAVMVDGEEEQVSLPELIAGYSRTSDYTRKTQQVAAARKAVEAELAELRQERQQYAAALPRLQEMLDSAKPPRPDPREYTDPMEFNRADRAWQEYVSQLDAVEAERNRVAEQHQRDRMAHLENIAKAEEQRLLSKIPTWQDTAVRQQESRELTDYLRGLGYTDEETANLIDHRAVLVARKAMQFDRLNVKAKARTSATKTVKPGSTQGVARKQTGQDVINRAKKTGKEEDFARAFTSLLG